MIYAFMSGKSCQDNYIRNFSESVNAKLVRTSQYYNGRSVSIDRGGNIVTKRIEGLDCAVFFGLLRGNAHILDSAVKNKFDFYYVDHAYFNSGYSHPNWMRVTKNGFAQNCIIPGADKDRLKQFNINFKDYKFNHNQNIVIFPPSNTVGRVFDQTNWETKTVKEIRKYTDRPIIIRKKKGPVMDQLMLNSISKERYNYTESIDQVLDNAYCVITFNSSIALTALERGIPVICDRYCPAFPLSHKFEEIENLEEKERLELFSSLAHGQFTMEEIKQKRVFDYINSIVQWEGSIK